jgi:hypothetical protein
MFWVSLAILTIFTKIRKCCRLADSSAEELEMGPKNARCLKKLARSNFTEIFKKWLRMERVVKKKNYVQFIHSL